MTDWQKGDLALCLKRGAWLGSSSRKVRTLPAPVYGEVCRVIRVGFVSNEDILSLWLDPYNSGNLASSNPFRASLFGKIRPSAIKHIEALKDVPLPVRENEHA